MTSEDVRMVMSEDVRTVRSEGVRTVGSGRENSTRIWRGGGRRRRRREGEWQGQTQLE